MTKWWFKHHCQDCHRRYIFCSKLVQIMACVCCLADANKLNWTKATLLGTGQNLVKFDSRRLIFIQDNIFENVTFNMSAIFFRPQCAKGFNQSDVTKLALKNLRLLRSRCRLLNRWVGWVLECWGDIINTAGTLQTWTLRADDWFKHISVTLKTTIYLSKFHRMLVI